MGMTQILKNTANTPSSQLSNFNMLQTTTNFQALHDGASFRVKKHKSKQPST